MADWMTTCAFALGCVIALYIGRRVLANSSYPLPPGPPGLPWAGNIFEMNTDTPWLTYTKWAKTYGDLVHSRLLGKDIIIINSEKVAKELLEKRSKNNSDRPYFITNELSGVDFNTLFLQYGDQWRLHRRFFHQTFRLETVDRFFPYQHHRTCHLLHRLLDAPEQLSDHVFEYTAAVVLNSTYNYDPESRKDELVDTMAKVLNIVLPALRPDAALLVGAFPWLLHLPSWIPGMSFKTQMAAAREYLKLYLDKPFEYSVREASSNDGTPSMVRDALHQAEKQGILPEELWMNALRNAAGTVFLAASETSNSVLMTCFLLMALHPEIQDRAYTQIISVVGRDKLPAIEDRPLLPYIDAIFRETIRYRPVVPLSIPHAAMEDDVYNGFCIPKGAIFMANVWSMTRDETKFHKAHEFIPDRFLNDDGSLKPNDVLHFAFGFGRRICVGRHFADASIWGTIAKVLAVFKFLNPLDENGLEVPIEEKFSGGVAVRPLPFKCRIVPRQPGMDTEKLEQLIAASAP